MSHNHLIRLKYPLKSRMLICFLIGLVIITLGWPAGGLAQENTTRLNIFAVESKAFPRVEAKVTAVDENGPLTGLTAANFHLTEADQTEAGQPVSPDAIVVVPDPGQPLNLVLALDLSMPQTELDQFTAAAISFIEGLEPADQVALITYYDEVNVDDAPFTADKVVVKETLNQLEAVGNRTDFYGAAQAAIDLFKERPDKPGVVVMLTNQGDNLGRTTVPAVIEAAQAAHIPIYSLTEGNAASIAPISEATGGQTVSVAGAVALQTELQAINQAMRQGIYRVMFPSGIKADDGSHNLTLELHYEDKSAQATTLFVAKSNLVKVTLLNLNDGQTVDTPITLSFRLDEGSAPIALARYLLNGQLLAEVIAPPFAYDWDPLQHLPGKHQLVVEVSDQAGNSGQTALTLDIPNPLHLIAEAQITTAEGEHPEANEVPYGGQVTLGADVTDVTGLAEVVFFQEGQEIGRDNAAPYLMTIAHTGAIFGEQRFTLAAIDNLGRRAEQTLSLHFDQKPAPPPSPPKPKPPTLWRDGLKAGWTPWQMLSLGGGTVTLLLGLALMTRFGIIHWQKRRRTQIFQLELANLGNIGDTYEVRASDKLDALRFQFFVEGEPLPERAIAEIAEPAATPHPAAQASPAMPAAAPPPPSTPSPAQAPAADARAGLSRAGQSAGQALKSAGALARLGSTIGSLLPGSSGNVLRQASSHVSRTQAKVSQVKQVKNQAGRFINTPQPASGAASASAPHAAPTSPIPAQAGPPPGSYQAAAVSPQPSNQAGSAAQATSVAAPEIWVELGYLAQDDDPLTVDMHVTPLNPYRSRRYDFKVQSRPIDNDPGEANVQSGQVQIKGISWLGRFWPNLLCIILFAFITLGGLYLIYLAGVFEAGRLAVL